MIRFILLLFFALQSAWALPVFNVNVATNSNFRVIWPDHENPRLFYILPKEFAIYEYSSGIHVSKNVLSTTFFADTSKHELKDSIKSLRSKYPDDLVEFVDAPIELESSEENSSLSDFFGFQKLNMPSLNDGRNYLTLVLELRDAGMKHILPILKNGGEIPFTAKFRINGYIKKADDILVSFKMISGIPVRLAAKRVAVFE